MSRFRDLLNMDLPSKSSIDDRYIKLAHMREFSNVSSRKGYDIQTIFKDKNGDIIIFFHDYNLKYKILPPKLWMWKTLSYESDENVRKFSILKTNKNKIYSQLEDVTNDSYDEREAVYNLLKWMASIPVKVK